MNVLDNRDNKENKENKENIDSLINKFKNYTISHPNISKLWNETLKILKNKIENLK